GGCLRRLSDLDSDGSPSTANQRGHLGMRCHASGPVVAAIDGLEAAGQANPYVYPSILSRENRGAVVLVVDIAVPLEGRHGFPPSSRRAGRSAAARMPASPSQSSVVR